MKANSRIRHRLKVILMQSALLLTFGCKSGTETFGDQPVEKRLNTISDIATPRPLLTLTSDALLRLENYPKTETSFFPPISSNDRYAVPALFDEVAGAASQPKADTPANNLDDLAKKTANPVASLISFPLQSNFDFNGGPNHDGFRYTLNIQPVIPIKLNDDWNMISRTILPVIYQNKIANNSSQSGLGDANSSLFFSPSHPGPGGLVWGIGPIFVLPTSTAQFLGAHRWGLGPTGLVLVQTGNVTYGILANHVWSIGRDIAFNSIDGNSDVSNSVLQPFFSYNFGHGLSATINAESTYDWKASQWTVPINLSVAQIIPIAGHPVSFSLGGRGYADGPRGTPQ